VPVEADLPQPLFALMQRSYDEALAPLRTLQKRIVIIGTAGLLGALLIGIGLAGGIIAPLQELVAGMDAENQALATGRDWRLLRPRVDQAERALSAVLTDVPQQDPSAGGEPWQPTPGG